MVATGRLAIGFDDQRYNAQTFWADGVTIIFDETKIGGAAATMIGKAVTFAAAADTVALCADGDPVIGKLIKVEKDGACTVQNKGNAVLPAGASATVTPGIKQVGAVGAAAAKGYIRNAASATAAELVRMGPFAWDNADMTAVVVDFGG